ncbi:MAG: hypothetical protein Q4G08_02690 [Capnocytophaga sp.]|nr:hypothetical protein [Capnocytophaga sp.]
MKKFNHLSYHPSGGEGIVPDYAAGFPPYQRGYHAMGYVLEIPDLIPLDAQHIFINTTLHQQDFPASSNRYANLTPADQPIPETWAASQLWNVGQLLQQKKIAPDKVAIWVSFDKSNHWETVAYIRFLRMLWATIALRLQLRQLLPIAVEVTSANEYMAGIIAQADRFITPAGNPLLDDKTIKTFIRNSLIARTVDPLGGSVAVEQKTINFYRKSCECLAQLDKER